MSEATHYWPSEDEEGEYIVEMFSGDMAEWMWDGQHWISMAPGFYSARSTEQMIEASYLGVRREVETPDNAATAQQALDEWRAVEQAPKAADWAYRWAVKLCERLGAR